MGQSSSTPHHLTQEDCDAETCCTPDETTPASISFDPSQSHIVSYGVDVQTNPKFLANMSLSSIAVRDATKIRDILVQTEIILYLRPDLEMHTSIQLRPILNRAKPVASRDHSKSVSEKSVLLVFRVPLLWSAELSTKSIGKSCGHWPLLISTTNRIIF